MRVVSRAVDRRRGGAVSATATLLRQPNLLSCSTFSCHLLYRAAAPIALRVESRELTAGNSGTGDQVTAGVFLSRRQPLFCASRMCSTLYSLKTLLYRAAARYPRNPRFNPVTPSKQPRIPLITRISAGGSVLLRRQPLFRASRICSTFNSLLSPALSGRSPDCSTFYSLKTPALIGPISSDSLTH